MQKSRTGRFWPVQKIRNPEFSANATTKVASIHFSKLTNRCVYFGFGTIVTKRLGLAAF